MTVQGKFRLQTDFLSVLGAGRLFLLCFVFFSILSAVTETVFHENCLHTSLLGAVRAGRSELQAPHAVTAQHRGSSAPHWELLLGDSTGVSMRSSQTAKVRCFGLSEQGIEMIGSSAKFDVWSQCEGWWCWRCLMLSSWAERVGMCCAGCLCFHCVTKALMGKRLSWGELQKKQDSQ